MIDPDAALLCASVRHIYAHTPLIMGLRYVQYKPLVQAERNPPSYNKPRPGRERPDIAQHCETPRNPGRPNGSQRNPPRINRGLYFKCQLEAARVLKVYVRTLHGCIFIFTRRMYYSVRIRVVSREMIQYI